MKKHGLEGQAVEIIGMSMATDLGTTFKDRSCIKLIGSDMTKTASSEAYRQANITAADVDVLELHDCFSANEVCGRFLLRGNIWSCRTHIIVCGLRRVRLSC